MKFAIASLFLAVTGLVNALPSSEVEADAPNLSVRAKSGDSCSKSGSVTCYAQKGQPQTSILVCSGGKWKTQANCARGTTCKYDSGKNWAWCG
ncbi:unnamed protein product [Clonostachys rhizophaga]|uniref:Antifungal protein n=1 Tax=Clonostachys rhizophaga TaxID=160324 RepID=A0A9N9W0L2_9HYPO|nr:unnamed protein product [Clonostachys rhizophaga]